MSPVRATWVPPQSSTENGRAAVVAAVDRSHRHDAHLVAVFLAEQRARAGGARFVEPHQPGHDRRVLQHDAIGDVLDRGELGVA